MRLALVSILVCLWLSGCVSVVESSNSSGWTRLGDILRVVDEEHGVACYSPAYTGGSRSISCVKVRN